MLDPEPMYPTLRKLVYDCKYEGCTEHAMHKQVWSYLPTGTTRLLAPAIMLHTRPLTPPSKGLLFLSENIKIEKGCQPYGNFPCFNYIDTARLQTGGLINLIQKSSVADPLHFGTDTDPGIRTSD
jgi:hypothetical protein